MMKQRIQNVLKGDPIIWAVVFLLSTLSILTVYSASSSLAYHYMGYNTEYYLFRQCILVVGSLCRNNSSGSIKGNQMYPFFQTFQNFHVCPHYCAKEAS